MADAFSNPNNRFVVQPAETSADTLQVTALSAANIVTSATSAVSFTSASLSRVMLKVTVNGTVYYVPCSTVAW